MINTTRANLSSGSSPTWYPAVPQLSTTISTPRFWATSFSTASPIGERQMFPGLDLQWCAPVRRKLPMPRQTIKALISGVELEDIGIQNSYQWEEMLTAQSINEMSTAQPPWLAVRVSFAKKWGCLTGPFIKPPSPLISPLLGIIPLCPHRQLRCIWQLSLLSLLWGSVKVLNLLTGNLQL